MFTQDQIDDLIPHIIDRIVSSQKDHNAPLMMGIAKQDKNWLMKIGLGHTLSMAGAIAVALFVFVWNQNSRMTAMEANWQFMHESLIEMKQSIGEVKRDIAHMSNNVDRMSK